MLKPRIWDERRDIVVPGDHETTLTYCVENFIQICQKAIADHGSFYVALSGGSTPKAIFEKLTSPAFAHRIDWTKVHLFWGDERSVPPDSPDSNYHMAMQAGLAKMPIPASHIHRMVAEKDIEKNALEYEKLIKRPFDLVMLGVGEDGHTASLFPDTAGLNVHDRLVIANHVPQKKTWRMTFTFTCINQAKNIVVYVLGSGKREILGEILHSHGTFPSEHVGTKEHKALWIADRDALPGG